MAEVIHKTSDVFGITRETPLNYVTREDVDGRLIESLTRDKHLVVYGSSKQGKTCLRKECLQKDDYITVHCSNKWSLSDLHAAILKMAGFELTVSTKVAISGSNLLQARASAGLLGIGASAESSSQEAHSEESIRSALDLDPSDVNDIISALEKHDFQKFIVLEDFHYLSDETQRDFAVALKAFHENSRLCFVIVGVWLEENRLSVYNGDLTGRVESISADDWSSEDLRRVISAGESLLNVSFDPQFVDALILVCQESVYIVQEACHQACVIADVHQTATELTPVGSGLDVSELVKRVVNQQGGRYISFLAQFADGFQDTELEMYRWLLYPVLTASPGVLEKGVRYADIRKSLVDVHPRGEELNAGNVTQALLRIVALQQKKDIKPIILDYDQTNLRLNVVDRGFLIWLRNQDRTDLLRHIDLPA